MKNNETLRTELVAALLNRVQDRLFDVLNDAVSDELVELMNETDWVGELNEDEQYELMYETFGRVYLGYQ